MSKQIQTNTLRESPEQSQINLNIKISQNNNKTIINNLNGRNQVFGGKNLQNRYTSNNEDLSPSS